MNADHIRAKTNMVFASIVQGAVTEHLPPAPDKRASKEFVESYFATLHKAKEDSLTLTTIGELVAQLLVDIHTIAEYTKQRNV